MSEFIRFLNDNAGVINLVFAGVVAVSTVVYAVLTSRLVKETRLMRMVQTEPKIEITVRLLEYAIHLARIHVRNIGLGPALDVTFSMSVASGGKPGQKLLAEFTQPEFFRTGLSYLGPGQERISHFSEMNKDHEAKTSVVLAFKVRYRSVTAQDYTETHVLDLSEFRGTSQLGKPHLYAIAQSLEKLQRDLEYLVTGFKRIKADVYTAEDRVKEREDLEAELDKRKDSAVMGTEEEK